MALVGSLEERRLTRVTARKNPRDKSTIISIFPREIKEEKITIFPTRYVIPKGSLENPAVLVVGPASWWKDIPESNQLIEVVHDSEIVAKSVVTDWMIGLQGYNPNAHPGLFVVPEEITGKAALEKFPELFSEAYAKQKEWFLALVNIADQFWSLAPNPRSVSELMRLAANELGMETKDWLNNYQTAKMEKCPACGTPRDTNFPVCGQCHMIVDMELFAKRKIQQPSK